MQRPRSLPRAVAACLVLALPVLGPIACGDDGPTTPVTPTTPGLAVTPTQYLDSALLFTREVFYYGDRIDWNTLFARAKSQIATAKTWAETYPAIDAAIDSLKDPHSFFYQPSQSLGNREDPNTPFYKPYTTTVASRVAYLWVPTFGGINSKARADSIQNIVATGDSTPNLCGWILDLRGNPGGFWPAMLAGLSPLITSGRVGGFVERDTTWRYFYQVSPGAAGLTVPGRGTIEYLRLDRTYTLRNQNLPIAILQGGLTASAGEIIVMAFKEPNRAVRTFGRPTYGVTSQPYTYTLLDRASVQVTAALMFDRQQRTYGGGSIPPDQDVTGPAISGSYVPGANLTNDAVVTAATNWLNAQPSCAAAPRPDADAPAARLVPGGLWRNTAPAPSALPPSSWPNGKGTPWVASWAAAMSLD